MKLLGFLLVILGIVLRLFKLTSSGITWVLIIIGAILLIAGYILKSRVS